GHIQNTVLGLSTTAEYAKVRTFLLKLKKTIVYLTYLRVLLDDVSRDVGRQDAYKFSKLTSSTVNDSDFLERQGNKKVCYFPLKRHIKENNAT
ncbi:hypothetical protein, partial [Vibrio alginolyticus]|uniref:hypothetical protein n=1 Tax=Vibrio alginolyticus TaxID=663 RepID=UPI00215D477C